MNPAIIIPTYISSRRRRSNSNVVAVYDHTTPLTQSGELPRCLDSLLQVQGIGQIIILVASEPGIEDEAAAKVQQVADRYPSLSIAVVGATEAALVQQRFEQLSLGKLTREVGLTGYSAVRNLGLVVACAMGFDAVVFLDDDVVVDDEQFLVKAMYGLGKLTRKGIPILAKTGYYLNSEGSYYSKSQDKWYNHFWQQGKAFNAWISKAMQSARLTHSNHVCGGCLAIHKEAFKRLSFDPWITRGEDLDYLLNLRMYGSDIWFDNKWYMKHLPPKTDSEGTRFRQDIYRWLYEYRKMEYSRTQIDLLQVKPASLEPYPGPFLEPGVERRVRITALLRSLGRPDKGEYRKAAKAATGEAKLYAQRNCSKYFEFEFVWPELMARVENDKILQHALIECAAQRRMQSAEARQGRTLQPAGVEGRDAKRSGLRTEVDGNEAMRQAYEMDLNTRQANAGLAAQNGMSQARHVQADQQVMPKAASIDPGKTTQIRLDLDE